MKYVNRNTGAVIESDCIISGGGWEPVGDQPPAKKTAKTAPKKKPTKTEEEG